MNLDSLAVEARSALRSLRPRSRIWPDRLRRVVELVLVIALAPIAIPLAVLIGAAILVDSPGPVFYRADRIGKDGRPFRMLKFRKMRLGAAGATLTLANDERFTPIGRFLTATRLDELPQLWHVLVGEMGLVGPRPETPEFVDAFSREYERILAIRPGITGPAQLAHFDEGVHLDGRADFVSHYRREIMPRKIELDLDYVRRHGPVRDLRLLLETLALPVRVGAGRLAAFALHPHSRIQTGAAVFLASLLVLVAFATGTGSAR